ncbi:mycofactocin biosynthesis peptidyl-dipeptidase MftE [Nocardioides jensenii]|uniref:mycofactocin biosynthesis peptidyl-dipeptidase MftE n=1 Tax=Nocardioides jensenii TaxID=1843 RepID=UPI000834D631|nr:mycofactocin biosynthesis peptidyl-dipeptidase MftE [Nocardioides jensenii]
MSRPEAPLLGRMRWTDLDEGPAPVLLVPLGSLEQHGPALGLATDALIAARVTRDAARRLAGAERHFLVAPTVPYGASGEHEGFPGTVSIGTEALRLLLVELARSACHWAEGVVFVNGHGGNVDAITGAVAQLRREGRAAAWTTCQARGSDAHAGRTETALLLALDPGSVDSARLAPGCTEALTTLLPRLRAEGVRAVSANGVLGDPTSATVEAGRRLHAEMVQRLVAELTEIDVDDRGRLRAGTHTKVQA